MNGARPRAILATLLAPLTKPVKIKVSIASSKKVFTITSQDEIPYLGFLSIRVA